MEKDKDKLPEKKFFFSLSHQLLLLFFIFLESITLDKGGRGIMSSVILSACSTGDLTEVKKVLAAAGASHFAQSSSSSASGSAAAAGYHHSHHHHHHHHGNHNQQDTKGGHLGNHHGNHHHHAGFPQNQGLVVTDSSAAIEDVAATTSSSSSSAAPASSSSSSPASTLQAQVQAAAAAAGGGGGGGLSPAVAKEYFGAVDSERRTCLHLACLNGHLRLMRYLLAVSPNTFLFLEISSFGHLVTSYFFLSFFSPLSKKQFLDKIFFFFFFSL